MPRSLLTSLLLALALVAGVSAHKPKPDRTAPIWVLTIHEGARAFVSDSYSDYDRAVGVAQSLNAIGHHAWAFLSRSLLHDRRGDGPLFGFFLPSLLAQEQLTPQAAIVLPQQVRQGEYVSPQADLALNQTLALVTVQLSDADKSNPNLAVSEVIEQLRVGGDPALDSDWEFRCGGSLDVPIPLTLTPKVGCGLHGSSWTTQPMRARLRTCAAVPVDTACLNPPMTLQSAGLTIAFQ